MILHRLRKHEAEECDSFTFPSKLDSGFAFEGSFAAGRRPRKEFGTFSADVAHTQHDSIATRAHNVADAVRMSGSSWEELSNEDLYISAVGLVFPASKP